MLIEVLLTVNSDGHVLRRNLFSMPSKVFATMGIEKVFEHRMVMIPKSILPSMYGGSAPAQLSVYTSRFLIAETERAAARLSVGFSERTDVELGDLTIIGTPGIIETLVGMGVDYKLALLFPTGNPPPESLYDGFKCVEQMSDDTYSVYRYEPSVSDSTDLNISKIIDGLESSEPLNEEELSIIDHFAKPYEKYFKLEMNNDIASDPIDSYDDGTDSDTADDELGMELATMWKAIDNSAQQIGKCIDMRDNLNQLMRDFEHFKDEYNQKEDAKKFSETNTYKDMLPTRLTGVEGTVNGLQRQIGLVKEEYARECNELRRVIRRQTMFAVVLGILFIISILCVLLK